MIYYEYDPRGARTSTKKTGVPDEAWEYDAAGRVLHYSSVQPGQGLSVGFPMMLNSPGFAGGGGGTWYDLYYGMTRHATGRRWGSSAAG